jgi:hypothetical protein
MTTTNKKEKIMDLIINTFPYDNGEDYDITFQIANNTFSPFQQVDYLINGIFKDVNLMNDSNLNNLDDKEKQNRKERIYTNGKIIHPIYKIKKQPNNNIKDSEVNNSTVSDDYDDDSHDYPDDSDVDDESDDVIGQQNRKRPMYSSRRGGNKKNKKQNRKTKKNSKK